MLFRSPHPAPYTLHPTPCTPHPSPCTLVQDKPETETPTIGARYYPKPEASKTEGMSFSPASRSMPLCGSATLHPTPCTLHPAPYTLHPTPCTLHPTPYTLRSTHWCWTTSKSKVAISGHATNRKLTRNRGPKPNRTLRAFRGPMFPQTRNLGARGRVFLSFVEPNALVRRHGHEGIGRNYTVAMLGVGSGVQVLNPVPNTQHALLCLSLHPEP